MMHRMCQILFAYFMMVPGSEDLAVNAVFVA